MSYINYNNSFIYTKPRHIRYLFLIDKSKHKDNPDELKQLMQDNMELWGGRYNPIIPMSNNGVDPNYNEFLNNIDPDIVCYDKGLDILSVKNYLNPIEYIELPLHFNRFKGLDSTYLINRNGNQDLLCENGYLYKSKIKDILGFYNLNFGFHQFNVDDHDLILKTNRVKINDSNLDKINKLITYKNIIHKAELSKEKIQSNVLKTNLNINHRVELVLAFENNQFEDLMYYWNMQLYYDSGHYPRQVYITIEELEVLSKDKTFHTMLASLSGTKDIVLSSQTINKSQLEAINQLHFKELSKYLNLIILDRRIFPLRIEACELSKYGQEPIETQILLNNQGIIKVPFPSFARNIPYVESWVMEIDIENKVNGTDLRNNLKFPSKSDANLCCNQKGRVTKENKLSFIVDSELTSLEFKIPNNLELFESILHSRKDRNGIVGTSIEQTQVSDAGKKLSAFIKLFNTDWTLIESFLFDRFWLNLFKSDSDVKKSKFSVSKGVFSYKDLELEYNLIHDKYKVKAKKEDREDDFEVEINNMLQPLIDKKGAFIGSKIKCEFCGSNKWYSYAELNSEVECKGCLSFITPQIETPLYYKLSDIVTGNILNSTTNNKKDFNGNYIVLMALIDLRQQSKSSFIFCPSMDYLTKSKKKSDIDILAIQDGKLILGEAKNNSSEFNNKEIDSLAWLGNNVKPDKLVLAYNVGKSLDDKVAKLKEKLKFQCEIIQFKVQTPTYNFRTVYGEPRESK